MKNRFSILWLAFGLAVCGTVHADWFSPAWSYRQSVTVSASLADSALANFPVLVRIADGDNPVFAHAASDGRDIVFTAADGVTPLNGEIEKFDASSGSEELIAWVRIPSLSATENTVIQMYYGGIPGNPHDTGVWDGDYVGVWHLAESAPGRTEAAIYRDSTANANHGIDRVSSDGKDGKVGYGQHFDRANTNNIQTTARIVWANPFTVSAWIRNDAGNLWQAAVGGAGTTHPYLIADRGTASNRGMWGYRLSNLSDHRFLYYDFPGVSGTNRIAEWTHVTVQRNPDTVNIYVNGSLTLTDNQIGTSEDYTDRIIYIGANANSSGRGWQGHIDEVRVSSVARSEDWIKAEYRSMTTPAAYLEFGAETGAGEAAFQYWYDARWPRRRWIRISSELTSETLYDFPVLLVLTNGADAVFSGARPDGHDLLFATAEDNPVKLSHEIERFDVTPGSEALIAWVRIPELSSATDTLICLYYGKPDAGDQQDVYGTWDDDFTGVWHLTESASGKTADFIYRNSAIDDYHGRDYVTASGKDGQVGAGQQFSRVDTNIVTTTAPFVWADPFTVEAWLRQTSFAPFQKAVGPSGADYPHLISDRGVSDQQRGFFAYQTGTDPNTHNFIRYDFPGVSGDDQIAEWTHVAVQRNPDVVRIYVNGELAITDPDVGDALPVTARTLNIGGRSTTDAGRGWDGYLDEVRLSSVSRSAAWIRATYRTTAAPGDYLALAAGEQSIPPQGTLILLR